MESQSVESTSNLERSALIVSTLTSFMGPFMISSVNVALPAIQDELSLNAVQLGWVATAYLLAVAVGLIPAGKYADIVGRKKIFVAGLAVYTLGTCSAGLSSSSWTLIASRILQGGGAAMFVTTGMAILTSVFPVKKRGKAIGLYVAAVYVGLSVGPFAGGIITQLLGWRAIFFVTLPLGILSIFITLHFLRREWYGDRNQKMDMRGCFLYGFAIVSIVYGATVLPGITGILLTPSGLFLLAIFIRKQRHASHPVFEVNLFFSNKVFSFSSFAALLNYSATFGVTFLLSLYLQYVQGKSPQAAGSILMAQPIMMALLSPLAGKLSDRIEARLLATAGMSITVAGVTAFSFLGQDTAIELIILNLILLGTGFALFSSPNMSAIMGSVEKKHYGQASAAVSTMRLLGQMLSMAIVTVVLAVVLGKDAIGAHNIDQFLMCIRIVFGLSSLLCLTGVYFSWFRGK